MSEHQPVELHRQAIYKNQRASELLSSLEKLSIDQISKCFDNGAVWLETAGKPQRLYQPDFSLKPGHKIHCYCNQTTLQDCPFTAELAADFTDFSIWNKPSGMLSQGSKWGDHWALYRWIKQNVWPDRESFITHRLDRFTSGLMLVAHNKTTNTAFHRLFENRKVHKTYRAFVSGLINQEETIILDAKIEQKNALTVIRVLDHNSSLNQSLVEIKPETGRKHQIRIHLAEFGHPVVNDRQYGLEPFSGDLKLQASELKFAHPSEDREIHIKLDDSDLLNFNNL